MDRLARTASIIALSCALTACGGGGSGSLPDSDSGQSPPPRIDFSADPTSIESGQTSWLSWSTQDATSCSSSDGWSGSRPTSGSYRTPALSSSTTYSLSCNGPGGGALARVTVSVVAANAPSVQLSASPRGVASGEQTTLSWTTRNVTSCTASGGWSGDRSTSGSVSVGPLSGDTTYRLNCSGPGGSAVAMTTVSYRVAQLSWTAPTENVDGTPLTDLAGYRVHWGTARRNYSQSTRLDGANNRQYAINLAPGTWYFAVTAVNAAGEESAYSGEVSKTVY